MRAWVHDDLSPRGAGRALGCHPLQRETARAGAVGMVMCGVAAALAFGTDVLIMNEPDVVGIRSDAMASVWWS